MYFNYHSKVKQVINDDVITKIEIVDNWNGISPAMVIYFKNHNPMPIREHKWDEYIALLTQDNYELPKNKK